MRKIRTKTIFDGVKMIRLCLMISIYIINMMISNDAIAHKIGPHLLDFNLKSEYEGFVSRVKPKVIKLVDANAERINRYYSLSPKSLFVIRNHPLSEQKSDMLKDPLGTGRRHADDWAVKAKSYQIPKSQMIFLGINEPAIWESTTYEDKTIAYTVAFLDRLKEHGLRGGALNLNTGHPRENGRPSYESLKPIRDAIIRGDHVLMIHEYWDKRGPDAQWPWNTGRFTLLAKDWNVKVIIGEAGIDEVVNGAKNHSGWRDHVSASEYRKQLMRYSELISQDKRIIGAVVFTAGGNHMWTTFETWDAIKDLEVNNEFGEPDLGNVGTSPDPVPNPTPNPTPTNPTMTSIPGASWTKVTGANASGKYWKLAKAEFLNEQASQGRHHIFSGNGVTLVGTNANGAVIKSSGDIPMWSQDEYCVKAEGQGVSSSDQVCGLRMEPKNHHVSYRLFFEVANASGGNPNPNPNPTPNPTPAPSGLTQALLNEAAAKQVIQFNPNAALQKAIFAANFVPNSGEFKINVSGQIYVAQRAEHLVTGEVRVYYCKDGDWSNVQFVKR